MNILIAEDDPFHRSFLASTVREALPSCDSLFEASGGQEAIDLAEANELDGVVIDLQMPTISGITAASRIWEKRPDMRILFWSNYSDEAYVRNVSRIVPKEAVYGYLLKTASAQRLALAMMSIFLEDQCVIDREVRGVQQRAMDVHQGLSNTEFEVLTDIALGLTDKAIATRRGISTRSVQSRLKQLYEKLGIDQLPHDEDGPIFNSRARAVAIALSRGLLNYEGMSLGESKLRRWLEDGK
ncbi:response regulator transcription factor [Oceanicola sp. D3]|uniref:response regulator transcription factor n=1 Tax=Oceanicola sp. D3 TaxID=2587163 RepID=UPI001120D3CA|nr:response regulator transcription factor [Oceanicola sp. D3]QDC08621.1 response regulator transcription factor [Oceanicola sp. D3]